MAGQFFLAAQSRPVYMAFADSRGPGNPTGSAHCAGPGNGSSRHTVVPLCGSHGRGASGIMSAVGSDGDILLDDEDELEIEIGAATQLSFIFESFLTRWCFRYMRIYCSFNNQNIHLHIQFRFKTYIFLEELKE